MQHSQSRSWFYEPWVWFNIVMLSISVIGGIVLMVICLHNPPLADAAALNDMSLAAKSSNGQTPKPSIPLAQ